MSKLEDFGNDQQLADEYSDVKTCPKSDLGYHCSCYDRGWGVMKEKQCCICETICETVVDLSVESKA